MPGPALHGSTPRALLSSWRPGLRKRSVRMHAFFLWCLERDIARARGRHGMQCQAYHGSRRRIGGVVGRPCGGSVDAASGVLGRQGRCTPVTRSLGAVAGSVAGFVCPPSMSVGIGRQGGLARPRGRRFDTTSPPYALLPDCPIDQLKQSRDGAIVLDVVITTAHSESGSSSIAIPVRQAPLRPLHHPFLDQPLYLGRGAPISKESSCRQA